MALRIGQVLVGQKATYTLVEALKASTVFKARSSSPRSATETGLYASSPYTFILKQNCSRCVFSAVVKTELGPKKTCLRREYHNYKLRAIASCQYIRTLLDVVPSGAADALGRENGSVITEDPYLVFELMDCDLRTVPSDEFRENSDLPKLVAKSVLSALVLLHNQYGAAHTGELFPTNYI